MDKYVLVCWPESQMLMGMEWFNECILMNDIDHLAEIGSSAYFVPADRYLGLIDYAAKGTPDGNLYTIEDVLIAGEMGEINHHDYKHFASLLAEARERRLELSAK